MLEEFGRPLVVQEVELAEPRSGEVLVRLLACGVCHTDLYTASGADPSGYAPTVLGHEGAGVVERVGADVTLGRARRPRRDAVLAAVPRVRSLPERPDEPLPRDPRAAEQGLSPGRNDAARPRRRADPALHGHVDVRGVHGDARDRAGEGQPRGAARACVPVRVRPLDRPRRGDEHREGRGRARRASSSAPAWSASARSRAAGCRAPSGSCASTSRPRGSSSRGRRARPTRSSAAPASSTRSSS